MQSNCYIRTIQTNTSRMPSIQLNNIPDDVYSFIQYTQSDVKLKLGKNVYSLQSAVVKIVKDHMKLTAPDFKVNKTKND